MSDEEDKQDHGPRVAGYDNLGHALYGHQCPFIQCLCGWQTANINRSWFAAKFFTAFCLERLRMENEVDNELTGDGGQR